MAEQKTSLPAHRSARVRVLRTLPAAPAPSPAPPAPVPAPTPAPWFEAVRPQSLFWRARVADLRIAHQSLFELRGIDAGVSAIVTNSVRTDPCTSLQTLTPLSFSIVARLSSLSTLLLDRHDVSASTVLAKFEKYHEEIDETRSLLETLEAADELEHAVEPFEEAFDPQAFEGWVRVQNERSPQVYEELQHRAALLLGVQCRVACAALDGDAPDWPPQIEPTPSTGSAPRAARAKDRPAGSSSQG